MDLDEIQNDILSAVEELPIFSSMSSDALKLRVKEYNNELVPGEEGTLQWTYVFPFCFCSLRSATQGQIAVDGSVARWKHSFQLYIGRDNSCTDGILKIISTIANALNGEAIESEGENFILQPGQIDFFSRGPGGIKIYTMLVGII